MDAVIESKIYTVLNRINILLFKLLCQSHRDKCFEIPCLLCISFCFVIHM